MKPSRMVRAAQVDVASARTIIGKLTDEDRPLREAFPNRKRNAVAAHPRRPV
jgi:hypothetical protein